MKVIDIKSMKFSQCSVSITMWRLLFKGSLRKRKKPGAIWTTDLLIMRCELFSAAQAGGGGGANQGCSGVRSFSPSTAMPQATRQLCPPYEGLPPCQYCHRLICIKYQIFFCQLCGRKKLGTSFCLFFFSERCLEVSAPTRSTFFITALQASLENSLLLLLLTFQRRHKAFQFPKY